MMKAESRPTERAIVIVLGEHVESWQKNRTAKA